MNVLEIILRSIALLCYYVSWLFPRKKSRWVFGGATGFNNNSKYFFLDVVENHPEIDSYWIGDRTNTALVRQAGYRAHFRYSLKGLWLCLTSGFYIVDHTQGCINFWTSGGAKVINLWHGVGWKACLWSNPAHSVYKQKGRWANYVHRLYYPHLYYKPDLLLSSSPYMTEHFFAPMFELPFDKCVEDEYPRCRFMLQEQEHIIEHIQRMGAAENIKLIETIRKYEKAILYAPTFRDAQHDFMTESGIDFDDFNTFLMERNWLFLVKCHPSTRMGRNLQIGHSHIIMLDKYVDSYYIMPFVNVLVSDYSSIVFDFMRLGRKIILFPFDIKKYNDGSRQFVFQYEDIVGETPIARTYLELKKFLADGNEDVHYDTSQIWDVKSDLIASIYSTK